MLIRVILTLMLFASSFPVAAHDGLPMVITIEQRSNDLFVVRLTVPPAVPAHAAPSLSLTPPCTLQSRTAEGSPLYQCRDLGLSHVELAYPSGKPAVPTLLRISWLSGESRSRLAAAGASRLELPSPESASGVLRSYFKLGLEHIATGWDHLLFLLCLLVIAGSRRRILWIVTGFTAGHAVTLSCAALDLVRLPTAPLEAAIALSIMILAAEMWRDDRTTLSWRYPVVVSTGFGLLHGFGFASALAKIGLPQTDLPIALLAFNLGIEGGQLAIVFVFGAAWLMLRRLPQHGPAKRVASVPVLAVLPGSIGGFWFVQRLAALVGIA